MKLKFSFSATGKVDHAKISKVRLVGDVIGEGETYNDCVCDAGRKSLALCKRSSDPSFTILPRRGRLTQGDHVIETDIYYPSLRHIRSWMEPNHKSFDKWAKLMKHVVTIPKAGESDGGYEIPYTLDAFKAVVEKSGAVYPQGTKAFYDWDVPRTMTFPEGTVKV